MTKRHYWPQRVTTSRRNTEEKEHGGSLPHQQGPEKRNPVRRSRTNPWEGGTATRTNACQRTQRQPEGQESNPPEGGKAFVTIADWGRTQSRPETGDPIVKTRNTAGLRNPETLQPHEGKPTSTWQRTRVTTSAAKLLRADNQGPSVTTPSYQQTLEARGKNPSKDSKKTPGAWTTKLQEPQAKTRTREGEFPQKEAGTQAGPQPTNPSEQTPKEENPGEKQHKERVRPEAKATERRNRDPRRAQHTGAAGGATDLWPNHPNSRAGEEQTDMNRRTNHEGQPRPPTSQLTDAVDTAG